MAKGDRTWTNARLATLDPRRPGLGIVENAAVAVRDGRILFAGPTADLSSTELAGAETRFEPTRAKVGRTVFEELRSGDVVLTLGAGDITRVAPELVRWLSAA